MKYFVSADVHGFYDEWLAALKEKKFDIDNPEHKLIVCGDLFDRGLQAKELQAFVIDLIKKDKIILVKGNHEDLAVELIDNYINYMFDIKNTHHWHNGTFQTLLALTDMSYNDATTCLLEFKRRAFETDYFKKIIPKMKNYYETEHYIFVHAWVPLNSNCGFDKNWRKASNKRWSQARWTNPLDAYTAGLCPRGKKLVFGHWHVSAFWARKEPKKYAEFGSRACFKPFVSKDIIALDACAAASKTVNVVVLED